MPVVRQLTEAGITAFRQYLEGLSVGVAEPPPTNLLTGEESSGPLGADVAIEDRHFVTKRDAAEHLVSRISGLNRAEVDHNIGLWGWLSLFYFDQVCPPAGNRARKPGQIERHIPSQHAWTYYRHLLAGPCRILQLHGANARLFLHGPLHVHGDFSEQVASHMELISNHRLVEALDRLYFVSDESGGFPKRGATTRTRAGNLRRFIDVFWQFHLMYDLCAMTADDILHLLPTEFDSWRAL
jgi:hypothetical protein